MTRWGMVVDLGKCIGCDTCTAVCSQMNGVPNGTLWREVPPLNTAALADAANGRLFLPLNCMHCSDPPCLSVCPTNATYQRPDGGVAIHDELCIGCGYCVVACPYYSRTICENDAASAFDLRASNGRTVADRSGICTKCDFCLTQPYPLQAADASPKCVQFCIADALHFGDLNDPEARASQLIAGHNTMRLGVELGTDPAVHYIVRDDLLAGLAQRQVELVPAARQQVWRWPAAFNFILGGMGGGLYLAAWASGAFPGQLNDIGLLAAACLIVGFLALTLEAGRPGRGIHLFRGWRHSWMSREAIAGLIFLAAVATGRFWPQPGLDLLAAAAAGGFIFSQGFILYRAVAVASWNQRIVPVWFVLSSLAAGLGLLLLLAPLAGQFLPGAAAATLVFLALDGLAWARCLHGEDRRATRALRRRDSLGLSLGLGLLLPMLILAISLPLGGGRPELAAMLAAAAGTAAMAGAAVQKWLLISKAGMLRSIKAGPISPAASSNGRFQAAVEQASTADSIPAIS